MQTVTLGSTAEDQEKKEQRKNRNIVLVRALIGLSLFIAVIFIGWYVTFIRHAPSTSLELNKIELVHSNWTAVLTLRSKNGIILKNVEGRLYEDEKLFSSTSVPNIEVDSGNSYTVMPSGSFNQHVPKGELVIQLVAIVDKTNERTGYRCKPVAAPFTGKGRCSVSSEY